MGVSTFHSPYSVLHNPYCILRTLLFWSAYYIQAELLMSALVVIASLPPSLPPSSQDLLQHRISLAGPVAAAGLGTAGASAGQLHLLRLQHHHHGAPAHAHQVPLHLQPQGPLQGLPGHAHGPAQGTQGSYSCRRECYGCIRVGWIMLEMLPFVTLFICWSK